MSELTKRSRVAHAAALDVGASPPASQKDKDANDLVRAVEFDIRPSCADEPARRYLRHGETLTPTLRGAPLPPDGSLQRFSAVCCSWPGFVRELKEMFLPAGYPDSVSEDYLTFQFWDTLQAMCSYLRGVLATQSVLQSVGVGDEHATPLAAALQWVLRDGSGMIGGLTFAYIVGPKFDVNVKRWRLFADVINDVGLSLDMVAPYFPSLVTQILCVSSICKTMCGVAAGSTRSSLMTHFAKRDNMADCAAKEGSQETAVKLFGLIFGMYFANAVNSSKQSIWVAFIVLTLVHVYANFNAVSCLCIPTLNHQRAHILIERFLQGSGGSTTTTATSSTDLKSADPTGNPFSIRSVNLVEPVFTDPKLPILEVVMGAQLCRAVPTHQELDRLLQLYADEAYILTIHNGVVHVVFQADMTPRDELRAFFQAVLILQSLENVEAPSASSSSSSWDLLQSSHAKMGAEFEFFFQQIQSSGWKTHMFLLNTSQWRVKLTSDA